VPLSEHEQRLLEQIEQALYADDPKFAKTYKSKDLRSHYRRRLVRSVLVLVVGLAVLLAGVITKLIALGVAGFVLMLVAASFAVASWQRMSGPKQAAARPAAVSQPRRRFVQRLEERWQRRQDER
jgi:hypothetical protein